MPLTTVYPNISERLPIITNSAHCARALSLVEQGDLYFGLGKTSPWEGEDEPNFVPPEPDMDATTVEELVGMKKADRVSMVIPSEDGEIEYSSLRFKTLTNEQAFDQKARWVLVECNISFEELPPVSYRQIGLFSRVIPKEGYEGKLVLLSDEIKDVGILEVLNNRKVVTRQSDTKDTYFMIIEC